MTAASENVISNTSNGAIEVNFDNNDGNQILRNRGSANAPVQFQPFIDLNPDQGRTRHPARAPTAGSRLP